MAMLSFRFASMNSGKSTQLLQYAHNYEAVGISVQLMTAQIDNRTGAAGTISSRLGLSRSADVFGPHTRFAPEIVQPGAKCLMIDEAQFLSGEQVKQLHRLAHLMDLPIWAYGLRSDFQGNPFEGSSMLLALADSISEITTVCSCGNDARMNIRLDRDGKRVRFGDQVQIGGNESYRSVCPGCFYKD